MVLCTFGGERAVVGAEEALVVKTRPMSKERGRCPECGLRCPGYDQGRGPRR